MPLLRRKSIQGREAGAKSQESQSEEGAKRHVGQPGALQGLPAPQVPGLLTGIGSRSWRAEVLSGDTQPTSVLTSHLDSV